MGTDNNVLLLVAIAVILCSPQTAQVELMSHPKPTTSDYHSNVYFPQEFDEHQMDSVSNIVESLVDMDILGVTWSTCLALERIDIARDTQGVVQVGFQLVLRESRDEETATNSHESDGGRKLACLPGSPTSGGNLITNGTANGTLPLTPPRDEPGNPAKGISQTEVTKTQAMDDNNGRRLSYTQMVVIATCSVVIGVFFTAAVGMRIRSYFKRIRNEEALARRPTFRSQSVALRSTHDRKGSDCQDGHRESKLNLSNGGVRRNTMAESSLERGDLDVRPLLKNTSTSGGTAVFNNTNETISGIAPDGSQKKITDFRRRSDPVHLKSSPPISSLSPTTPPTPPRVIVEDTDQCSDVTLGGVNNAYQSPTDDYNTTLYVGNAAMTHSQYTPANNADQKADYVPYTCPQSNESPPDDMQSQERLLDFRDWPPSTRAKPHSQPAKCDSVDSCKDAVSTDTVLTQSDSSISTENPPYRYGNQSEYTASPHNNNSNNEHNTQQEAPHGGEIAEGQKHFDNISFQLENDDSHGSLPASIPIVRLDPAPKGRLQRTAASTDPTVEGLRTNSPSDDEASEGESDSTVLLAGDSSSPNTPKDTLKVYDERSFLLGPEFEGMEPTYV